MSPVLGIDPSSSCSGLAVVDAGELVSYGAWQPSKRVKKLAAKTKGVPGNDIPRLAEYFSWLNSWMRMHRGLFTEVAVEDLGVTRGAKVARVLSHFQAASCIVAYRNGYPVTQIKAGVGRNILLGCPITISKEKAQERIYSDYKHIDWSSISVKSRGDVMDAFVLAAAREKLALN